MCSAFLRIVCNYWQFDMMQHPRRLGSLAAQLWGPQIWYCWGQICRHRLHAHTHEHSTLLDSQTMSDVFIVVLSVYSKGCCIWGLPGWNPLQRIEANFDVRRKNNYKTFSSRTSWFYVIGDRFKAIKARNTTDFRAGCWTHKNAVL